METVNLGERIAMFRKKRNLTQTQLALKLEMSQSAIAMWETGKRDPDTEMLAKIADFFNVTVDELLGRTEGAESHDPLSDFDDNVRSLAREIQSLDSGDIDLLSAMIKTMRERGKEAKNKK